MTGTPLKIENFRLAAALAYARLGWLVIPLHTPNIPAHGPVACSCKVAACKSIGKHPRTQSGLKDATCDPDAIREWWRQWPSANIGIVTGAGSGIVVLDVDPRDGGSQSLGAVMDEHGEISETVESQTGSVPAGMHLIFAHPGKVIPNSTGRVGAGLDVRGDGGYIVAPPSLHASGERYAWAPLSSPEHLPPVALPRWLMGLMLPPVPPPAPKPVFNGKPIPTNDPGSHWLDKAISRVGQGGARNDTGLWLAAQLRDSGLPESAAEVVMRTYVERAPAGDHAYTTIEAARTLRQAYSRPAREPAKSLTFAAKVMKANPAPVAKVEGAAAELSRHYEDIISRRIFNVPWPWPQLTTLTQALVPGTFTVVCGDPGVGKTFFVLQCLRFWLANGFDPVVYFIEKDRKFHTRRLLAQLEHDGRYINWDWIPGNAEVIRDAIKTHAGMIDDCGRRIESSPHERVTLDSLLNWIRQQASAGRRVLVIDPITAVSAGADRWTKDDDFVIAAQSIATAHECSIVLVTHAKKGNRPGSPSGHDMAAGAAYYRFADTTIWLARPNKPRNVRYQTVHGPTQGVIPIFFQLHKTRDGTGANHELAYTFRGMEYAEQGIVTGEVRGGAEEEAA